jgi:outer membrane lipoprotein carrier protein
MKKAWLAAIWMAASSAAFAQGDAQPRLGRVLEQMQSAESGMERIRFSFRQQIAFTGVSSTTTVNGKALFAKGGKFRIEKMQPERQLTISNGKSLWVYTPAYNQVWQGTPKRWMDSTLLPKGMLPFNNYVADLQKYFDLKLGAVTAADNTVELKAEPKDQQMDYHLTLVVSMDSWLPSSTRYHSESADVVTELSEVEANPDVTDSSFRFTAPKGADVIPLN